MPGPNHFQPCFVCRVMFVLCFCACGLSKRWCLWCVWCVCAVAGPTKRENKGVAPIWRFWTGKDRKPEGNDARTKSFGIFLFCCKKVFFEVEKSWPCTNQSPTHGPLHDKFAIGSAKKGAGSSLNEAFNEVLGAQYGNFTSIPGGGGGGVGGPYSTIVILSLSADFTEF